MERSRGQQRIDVRYCWSETGEKPGELLVGAQCYETPGVLLTLQDPDGPGIGSVEIQIPYERVGFLIGFLREHLTQREREKCPT